MPGPCRKANCLPYVAQPQTAAEQVALRHGVERGVPYGSKRWQAKAVRNLGLEKTHSAPKAALASVKMNPAPFLRPLTRLVSQY